MYMIMSSFAHVVFYGVATPLLVVAAIAATVAGNAPAALVTGVGSLVTLSQFIFMTLHYREDQRNPRGDKANRLLQAAILSLVAPLVVLILILAVGLLLIEVDY